ncbi:MAG TPA: alpha/beta fold hydrolase [Candidatus Bacteroides pullicola]|uniref:Alpha/beta fold hydrolase n=1 Tax=Candidatus Bacteroides pullicola TaxID=2838475 RepID=A0A9D1ZHH3_9BACE|nr:alpha/beta fold hydrolase [Candidatus Bacteroides pullicola]
MMRRLLLILCLCLLCIGLRAQTVDRLPLAKCAYLYFVSGQGEALRTMLSDEMQAALPAAALSGMFNQLTAQFGALQSTGEWHQVEAEGMTICFCDLAFEKYTLRFQTAFDAAGRIAGLFVKPAPKPVAVPAVSPDSLVEEQDTVVVCGTFRLPATLCLPRRVAEEDGSVPCVVLVHGSGPHDRNETIGPNHPFRDLAWGLAARGIATLRYDKRTYIYRSNSVPQGRQLDLDVETVDDAVAAAALARTLPGVEADSVYVLGHSQGGWLAPRIADRDSRLAGIILLAAPARPLEDLLLEQVTYLNSLAPSAQGRQQVAELQRRVENVKHLGTSAFCDTIPFPFDAPRSYWADIVSYRPVETALRLTLPLVVLQAERDYQVTMQDYGLWRMGLLKCKNASFKSYPKLNHLLQEGTGKATPDEYQQPSSVPAYVLDDLARFVRTGRL